MINITKPKFKQSKRVVTTSKPSSNMVETANSPLPIIKETTTKQDNTSPIKAKMSGMSLDNQKPTTQHMLKTEECKIQNDYSLAKENNNQSMLQIKNDGESLILDQSTILKRKS